MLNHKKKIIFGWWSHPSGQNAVQSSDFQHFKRSEYEDNTVAISICRILIMAVNESLGTQSQRHQVELDANCMDFGISTVMAIKNQTNRSSSISIALDSNWNADNRNATMTRARKHVNTSTGSWKKKKRVINQVKWIMNHNYNRTALFSVTRLLIVDYYLFSMRHFWNCYRSKPDWWNLVCCFAMLSQGLNELNQCNMTRWIHWLLPYSYRTWIIP